MAGNKTRHPARIARERNLPADARVELCTLRDHLTQLSQRTNQLARHTPTVTMSRAAIIQCLDHMADRLSRVLYLCGEPVIIERVKRRR